VGCVGFGERMDDPGAHAGMYRELVETVRLDPGGLAGLVMVRVGFAVNGQGVEADRELLAGLAGVGVGHDVHGVGIDAGEAGGLDRDSLSSTTSRSAAAGAVSPSSTRPPGSSQLPLSLRRTRSSRPVVVADRDERGGVMELGGGALSSW